MKTLKIKQILFVIVALLFCLTMYAEQNEKAKQEIQFVISNDQEELNLQLEQYPEVSKPSYISVISLKNEIQLPVSQIEIIRSYYGIAIFSPNSRRTYSPNIILIRCALRDSSEHAKPLELTFSVNPNNERLLKFKEFVIFANSEQEARELTESFIKIYDDSASKNLETLKKDIEKKTKLITQLETEKPLLQAELEKLRETSKVNIEEYAKANYSTQDETSVYKLTEKHTQELADLLRNVNFELAGLNAKITSIDKYKKSEVIIDNETIIKLNQILISTDIERAGALARKQAYETAFNQANELYNLLNRKYNVIDRIEQLPGKISIATRELRDLENDLEVLPAPLRSAEIEDKKVIIKPVRQD